MRISIAEILNLETFIIVKMAFMAIGMVINNNNNNNTTPTCKAP